MRIKSLSRFQILLVVVACALAVLQSTHLPGVGAGGPLVTGNSAGFGIGTDGQPLLWASPALTYQTDGPAAGLALGNLTAAQADARVATELAKWDAITTSNLSFTRSGSIPNAFAGADGDVNTVAEFNAIQAANCPGNEVVYDVDGSLTTALGFPANQLLGFAGPCSFNGAGQIASGNAFFNGQAVINFGTAVFDSTVLHEFGHFAGFGHTQINNNCFTGAPGVCDNTDDAVGFSTMSPIAFGLLESGLTAELTLAEDDIEIASRFYPSATFNTTYAIINGTVFATDGVTPIQGVNVIARQVNDPVTPVDESRTCVFSGVSGDFFSGNPGQTLTGDNNPGTGPVQSPFGSRNPSLIGTFTIAVRATSGGACTGATVGQFTLNLESIDSNYTGGSGVGSLGGDSGEQIPMPGTAPAPLAVNVAGLAGQTLNNNNLSLVGTQNANDGFDAVATNDTPGSATSITNGTINASISPWRGSSPDMDVYAFTALANQTVTFNINARTAPYNDFLDSVIQVVNAAGTVQNFCDTVTAGVFTGACQNDDETPGVLRDSLLNFRSGAGGTFFVRVFDWRGDARPDFRYDLVVTGAGAAPASAGCTKTFDGGPAGTGTDWTTAANWSPDTVPGAADNVCIGTANVTLNASTTVNSIADLSSGSLTITSGTLTATTSILVNGGTLFQNGGSVSTATLTLSSGVLQGTGTLTGNVNQTGGDIRPGTSPGILNITGNFTQSVAGTWTLEIGGTAGPGVNPNGHDQINGSGTALVDGTINITLTNGFTPAIGDSFTLATCGGGPNCGSGNTTINFPAAPPGGVWQEAGTGTALIVQVVSATKDFTGGGDGTSWNDANNWTPSGVPIPTDNVTIGGNFAVTVDGAQSAGTLTVTSTAALTIAGTGSLSLTNASTIGAGGLVMNQGSSLVLGNSLSIAGLFAWNGGAISSGGGGTLDTNGGVNITGGATLDAVIWNNNGAVTHSAGAGAALQVTNGATINFNTGTWDATGDGGILDAGGAGGFNNSATFTRSASPGQYLIQTPFRNQPGGAVNVNTGTLRLEGGGDCGAPCAGTWAVAMNAELDFGSGSYQINSSVSGAGTVRVSGGIAITGGTYNITGTTRFDGGTSDFLNPATVTSVGALQFFGGSANFVTGAMAGAAAINPTSFTFNSGTLTGYDTVNVPNLFTFGSGTMTGGGITNVNAGVNLTGAGMLLNNRTFNVNNSTAIISGAGQLTMEFASTFNLVGATAVLQLENNSSIALGAFAPSSLNLGAGSQVQRTAAAGTFTIGVNVNNNGGTFGPSTGTVAFTGAYTQNSGSLAINSGSGAIISTTTVLTINGGTVDGIGGAGGSSIVGNVNNVGGTMRPGTSPGIFNITGNYTQGAAGTLLIEIGGIAPGTGFDVMNVTGVATLAGTLNVQPLAFVPSGNFQIMTFGSRVGDFGTFINGTASPTMTPTAGATNYVLGFAAAACGVNAVASGDWANPATWNPGVPTGADNVCIDADQFAVTVVGGAQSANTLTVSGTANPFALSGGSLSLAGGSSIAGAFTQSGGTLDGAGSLAVGGVFTWSSGTQQGAGTTTAMGGMTLNTGGTKSLTTGRTLSNNAAATWSDGEIFMGNGAVFNNTATGTFDIQHGGTRNFGGGLGGASTVNNAGTMVRSAGGGLTVVNAGYNNTGVFNANDGTFRLISAANPSTSTGAFNVGAGSLEFNNGTYNLNGGATVSGAGTTTIASGTVNMNAGSSITTAVAMSSGTLNLATGGAVTLPTLTQTGGTVTGTDTLNVTGAFTWGGGDHTSASTTNANGGMSLTTGNQKVLNNGRTLNNTGVATWADGDFLIGNNAVFNNTATGTFDIQHTATRNLGGGVGGPSTVNNAGTMTKSAGGGLTGVNAGFNNTGTFNANDGTFRLISAANPSTSTGAFNVGAGTLEFNNGTYNLNSGATVSGAGTTTIPSGNVNMNAGSSITTAVSQSGGVLNLATGGTVTLPSLTQTGGTVTGTGILDITGVFTWSGGDHTGTGTTNANGGMPMGTGNTKSLNNGRTLANNAAATWLDGEFFIGNGAVFSNTATGTFDIQHSGTRNLGGGLGGASTVNNAGTMVKSAGGGLTVVNAGFNNTGTFNANNGTFQLLSLANASTSTGAFNVGAGSLEFNNGTYNLNGATVSGAGTTTVASGTVNMNVGSSITTAVSMTSGALNVLAGATATLPSLTISGGTLGGTGTVDVNGTLAWSGGRMSDAGITNANSTLNITNQAQLDNGRTLNNDGLGTWSAGDFFIGNGATFVNTLNGLFNITHAGLQSWGGGLGGVSTVNNAGTITKSGASLTSVNATFNNNAGAIFNVNAGNMQFNTAFTQSGAGSVTFLNGGNFSGGITFNFNGGTLNALNGSSITGNLNNAGAVVNPGTSPGILNIMGNYVQGAGGTLNIELAGNGGVAGTDFDLVAITGSATLNGTLNVIGFGGFTTGANSSYQVMTYASVTGDFAAKNGLGLATPALQAFAQPTFYLLTNAVDADLTVTKTDTPDPTTQGGNITYTITVTNNGPFAATNLSLTDNVPVGTTFVSFTAPAGWGSTTPAVGGTGLVTATNANLAIGAPAVFTLVVATSGATPALVSNTATVAAAENDPNPADNSATATTTVNPPSADLSITKTDTPDPTTQGGNITYTITVTNNGPDTATNVSMTDVVPAGTTFVSFTAPAGWTSTTPAVGGTGTVTATNPSLANAAVASFTLVVATSGATPALVSNTADVTATEADPVPANNSATTTTTVNPPSADLSITKTDTPDPATQGGNITYTITVTNNGPDTATNVSMTDVVPAGTTFVSFTAPAGWTSTTPAVGGTGTVTATNPSLANAAVASFTLVVATSGATPALVSNTADVTATEADPVPANNSATTTTTVNPPQADLAITKTDAPDPVNVGANITYTITVTNNGPNAATSVSLSDTLPAGTTFVSFTAPAGWTSTTPAVGGTGTVTATNPSLANAAVASFTLVVAAGPTAVPSVSNTATVTAVEADPNAANNSATAATTVNPVADLSITKTDSPDPVAQGSNITYTITVANAGPSPAAAVTVTDNVPAGTTFVSATPSVGTCPAPVGGVLTCNLGILASGANATISMVVTATGVGPISNTATVTTSVTDPNAANNSATATTAVTVVNTDFSIAATPIVNTVRPGETATFTVTIAPNPPGSAFNLPVGLACFTTPPLSNCTFSPQTVTPGANPVNATLSITVPSFAVAPPSGPVNTAPPLLMWLLALSMALVGVGVTGRRLARNHLALAPYGRRLGYCVTVGLALLVLSLGMTQSACTKQAETISGPYTVTVSGSAAGGLNHSTTVTVNVQQP